MNFGFECYSCILRQGYEAATMVTDNDDVIREILSEICSELAKLDPTISPPEFIAIVHQIIKKKTGVEDPYAKIKAKNMKTSLQIYPKVEKIVSNSDDPLLASLVMSAVGNSIDTAVGLEVDIVKNIEKSLQTGLNYSDYGLLKEELDQADNVLIIADNTGEAVFDRLLLKELNKLDMKITYVVRSKAVLNDITIRDAKKLNIDSMAEVIESGTFTPGVILSQCNDNFKNIYYNSDLIISKGQGNLEGLSNAGENIFFLLKAKCKFIEFILKNGIEKGDLVLIKSDKISEK
ncbi:damage-control phosphatase ARMT1 family protein [Halanaerobium hydrogeniformans]|uniref:Damage-control phosphatase ARMT1-like metal-binding domain-containing protein n=1 Tax=Halanaerobium hydrogeniformans TaxID=656519 RepID=E4RMC8_HALHG|nr:ARMT1-like domain-containing protein [Halanaerobium hydrogeniformans]ADQ14459.1 protein of unknown function DUF89 [Halanaerobium hydrogeniformans]